MLATNYQRKAARVHVKAQRRIERRIAASETGGSELVGQADRLERRIWNALYESCRLDYSRAMALKSKRTGYDE